MRFDRPNPDNKIGEGRHKQVFPDQADENRVLKFYKDGKRKPGYLESFPKAHARAVFYFHKILNLLFPENFPDVSGAGVNVLRSERVPLDERHQSISRADEMMYRKELNIPELQEAARASKEIRKDPRYIAFVKEMIRLGIYIDDATINYSVDTAGNLKYLDDVDPWHHVGIKEIQLSFDSGKLKEAIDKLDEEKREKALVYFERMEQLREEENEKIREKNKPGPPDVTTYI